MREGISEIIVDGQTVAYVFTNGLKVTGTEFLTPSNLYFQIGAHNHPKGKVFKPHAHNLPNGPINVSTIEELIFVTKGKAKFDFYDADEKIAQTVEVTEGEAILTTQGAHGGEILEDGTEFFEIKQGPYPGDGIAKKFI